MGPLGELELRAWTPFDLLTAAFRSRLVLLLELEMGGFPSVTLRLWPDLFREGDPEELMEFFTAPP